MEKKILLAILTAFLLINISYVSALTPITNCTDLQNMENDLTEDYVLSNNIDCSDTINWNGGNGFVPIGNSPNYFEGTLDGQGYNITDLYVSYNNYAGLFYVLNYAEIKNVGLINANVTAIGIGYGGILAGNSQGSNITNTFSTGSVTGGVSTIFIGGLIGEILLDSYVNNSYSTAEVIEGDNAGGLVGYSDGSIIENSYSTGDVQGDVNVGGFVGGLTDASVTNSYSTGDVICLQENLGGGFIGYVEGLSFINNSYSRGSVTNGDISGGFVGFTEANIYNSYSTGFVNSSGGFVGGFAGDSDLSLTDNGCFWDNETSGQLTSTLGTAKTTAQLQTQSTFTDEGWDFVNVWQIADSEYPTLQIFGLLPEPPVEETITEEGNLIQGSGTLYTTMKSSGAGLGKFMQYITQSLPLLLIGIMIVGVVFIIGIAIASVFNKFFYRK